MSRKLTRHRLAKRGVEGTPMRGTILQPNIEGTRKVLLEMEDGSKRALQAAVCIPEDEPIHQIAYDHSEAKRRADVLGERTVSNAVPKDLADSYRDSTERFARSAELFLAAWAEKTTRALERRTELCSANPQFMKDATAKWEASAKRDPDRAELLEARITLAKLTLLESEEGYPPCKKTVEHVRTVLDGARREHRESATAGRHPHVLLLEELLIVGLEQIIEGRAH